MLIFIIRYRFLWYCGAVYSIPLADNHLFIIEFNRYFAKAFSPIVDLTSHTLFLSCGAEGRGQHNFWVHNYPLYDKYYNISKLFIFKNHHFKQCMQKCRKSTCPYDFLKKCYAFYILPKCIRNLHTEFEMNRTILN